MLRCIASSNQPTWSEHLALVEYAHNSSTSAATAMSLFEASLGYQPLFLSITEVELAVPICSAPHALLLASMVEHEGGPPKDRGAK